MLGPTAETYVIAVIQEDVVMQDGASIGWKQYALQQRPFEREFREYTDGMGWRQDS